MCLVKRSTNTSRVVEIVSKTEGVHGLEINISCPNVKKGGIVFGTDPDMAYEITKEVKSATDLPVIVKLTPNVTDICVIAESVQAAGADAISLINTLTGMSVDIEQRIPHLANITGGLSGPAIKPIALRMVWQVAKKVTVPVIGVGGITSARDAMEFLMVGARAVQIGDCPLHQSPCRGRYRGRHGELLCGTQYQGRERIYRDAT